VEVGRKMSYETLTNKNLSSKSIMGLPNILVNLEAWVYLGLKINVSFYNLPSMISSFRMKISNSAVVINFSF
jgi:hypothetical protein